MQSDALRVVSESAHDPLQPLLSLRISNAGEYILLQRSLKLSIIVIASVNFLPTISCICSGVGTLLHNSRREIPRDGTVVHLAKCGVEGSDVGRESSLMRVGRHCFM